MKKYSFNITEQISADRIQYLVSKGIHLDIASINLELIKLKIQMFNKDFNWTDELCEKVEVEYKRFLTLAKLHPEMNLVPNMFIDSFWHFHILDTVAYFKDCNKIFGHYFHHYPYSGIQNQEDEHVHQLTYKITKELYLNFFHEEMTDNLVAKCDIGGPVKCKGI